jgi:GH35 family endo-1,4-beta-xylanase
MKSILTFFAATFIAVFILIGVFRNLSAEEMPPLPDASVMSETYRNAWNDDVQKQIDERIEKYRKADTKIELSNVKPGTKIRVEQISSQFLFGAATLAFDQLGSEELNARYKAEFEHLFNAATIQMYWKTLEPEQGNMRYNYCDEDNPEFWAKTESTIGKRFWSRAAPDPIVEFCDAKGIYKHGHPMIWGHFDWQHPDWLAKKEENISEMERLFEKHIIDLIAHYQNRIDSWDIVNESSFDRLCNPKDVDPNPSGYYGILPRDYAFKAFKTANRVIPDGVVQQINDFRLNQQYLDQILDLCNRGIKIDIIGLQMNFWGEAMRNIIKGNQLTPKKLEETLTLMDKAGIPTYISEVTLAPPKDEKEGTLQQAVVTRNLYRYWFSWHSIQGITWWTIIDGLDNHIAELNTRGIFTRQMEPKPAYYALDRLINHEWKTNFVRTAESENVSISFRGFKGKYKIFWIDKEGKEQIKELTLK